MLALTMFITLIWVATSFRDPFLKREVLFSHTRFACNSDSPISSYNQTELLLKSTLASSTSVLLPKGTDLSLSEAECFLLEKKEVVQAATKMNDLEFLREEMKRFIDNMSSKN